MLIRFEIYVNWYKSIKKSTVPNSNILYKPKRW